MKFYVKIFVIAWIALIGLLQVVFIKIQSVDSQNIQKIVSSVLLNEKVAIDPQAVSISILDLARLDLISCYEVRHQGATFLKSNAKNCEQPSVFLNGEFAKFDFTAINGTAFEISFRTINSESFILNLWISRIGITFIAAFITFLFWRRTHELMAKESQTRVMNSKLISIAKQVSHDLKSPLTAIQIMLSQQSEHKEMTEQCFSRISDILSDLNRGEYKASEPAAKENNLSQTQKLSVVAPAELLKNIISEKVLETKGLSKKVEVALDNFLKTEALIQFDSALFSRVFSNLINNSIESISEDGIVKVSIRTLSDSVYIQIQDNGCGIDEETLKKLGKERVTQGKEGKGSGLGFFHARETIEKFNGDIQVISRIGSGTIVQITLPMIKPAAPL